MGTSKLETKETFLARVISGGRITIPEEVRELHGIKKGDLVRVSIIEVKKR